jgi:hypothetical protein
MGRTAHRIAPSCAPPASTTPTSPILRRDRHHRGREHALLDVARAAGGPGAARRSGRRRRPRVVHDDLRVRRYVDEPRRHAHEPAVSRELIADSDRDGRARPRLRRARRLRRLRQDAPGHPDGDGAAERAVGVRVRRRDAARPPRGADGTVLDAIEGVGRVQSGELDARSSSMRSSAAACPPSAPAPASSPRTRWRWSARRSASRRPARRCCPRCTASAARSRAARVNA